VDCFLSKKNPELSSEEESEKLKLLKSELEIVAKHLDNFEETLKLTWIKTEQHVEIDYLLGKVKGLFVKMISQYNKIDLHKEDVIPEKIEHSWKNL